MWHSYRLRLFVGLLLVAVLSIVLVSLITSRGVADRFGRYVDASNAEERQAIAEVIEYQLQQSGVDAIGPFAGEIGRVFDQPITLSDEQGNIVFSSQDINTIEEHIVVEGDAVDPAIAPLDLTLSGDTLQIDEVEPLDVQVHATTQMADGTLTTITYRAPLSAAGFLNQTNLLLFSSAIVALLLAGLASLWLSRSFIRPVDALTQAAEGLAQGDLTRRVAVERPDELGRLAASFNTMAGSLEEQERLRRQMVGDIAHELRTPLGNVRGYLEAAQDGVVATDDALIASLHEETLLLSHLIQDLQDLSLAEAGQLRLSINPQAPADLLEAAVRAQRPQAGAKDITVTIDTSDDLPLIAADAERTGQVLRNLLGNALVHTPVGGEVHLSAEAKDGGVVMRVGDNGPGIDPDHLPHIFDRFYRADAARDRATGGAGLGLAIAQAYVTRQNGRLGVESRPGEGAVFWVWLPEAGKSLLPKR
ncbi:MAG: ATP-binding protein [Chloroflexota bacterium]